MKKLLFWDIAWHELGRFLSYKVLAGFAIVGPFVLCILLTALLWNGVMRHIPVAILDKDNSVQSREFTAMVDASPALRLTHRLVSEAEGMSLIRQGEINGMLIIPVDFSKDLMSGRQTTIIARYNNQMITQGGTLNKAFTELIATFSAKYTATKYIAQGVDASKVLGYVMPISVENQLLFNPSLDYSWFLLLGILPSLWQLFAMGTVTFMMGTALRKPDADLMPSNLRESLCILLARLAPYIVIYCVQLCFIVFMLFAVIKIPLRGSFFVVLLGALLFVMASVAVAAMVVTVIKRISFSMSVISVYVAPAFAYAGVTFPYEAMPALAKFWSQILPITHFHRLLIDAAIRNAPVGIAMASAGALVLFMVAGLGVSAVAYRFRMAYAE